MTREHETSIRRGTEFDEVTGSGGESATDQVEVVVYVREACPYEATQRQRKVISRLCRLEEEERIGDVAVRDWGVRADIAPRCETAHDTYELLLEWAGDHGCSLEPAFSRRTRTSFVGSGTDESLSFPVICLTVWEAEALAVVFPYKSGNQVYTVADGVEWLAANRPDDHPIPVDDPTETPKQEVETSQ